MPVASTSRIRTMMTLGTGHRGAAVRMDRPGRGNHDRSRNRVVGGAAWRRWFGLWTDAVAGRARQVSRLDHHDLPELPHAEGRARRPDSGARPLQWTVLG